MAYAEKRGVPWKKNVTASISDNVDIDSLIVPAGREIQVFGMKSFTRTKSPTASAKIELCDASNNILASVSITQNNGTIAKAGQTFPFPFTAGTSDAILKLRTDQATGAGCDVDVEVHLQYPGN